MFRLQKANQIEKRAVVLGKNYSTTLGVVRSLGEQGYKVHVCFVSRSKWQGYIVGCSRYIMHFTRFESRDDRYIVGSLIKMYKDTREKTPLIASDDYTASLIDRHLKELLKYFILPCSGLGGGEIVRLMDKSVQISLAQVYGLRTARSWIITQTDDTYTIPEDVVYPCFFKPLMSFKGGKDGMKRCNSERELQTELGKLKGFSVLVQEYLEIEAEYSISGLCWDKQIYLPALMRKIQISQAHKGTTAMGVIEPFDLECETYRNLTDLLASLRLKCIVDVELFYDGKEMIFNEINFRTSAVCYGIVAGGANIPGMFADTMQSDCFSPRKDHYINYGMRFLCEKAAWDDYIAGILNRKELQALIQEADSYILSNKNDPKPEIIFQLVMRILLWKTKLKRLLLLGKNKD